MRDFDRELERQLADAARRQAAAEAKPRRRFMLALPAAAAAALAAVAIVLVAGGSRHSAAAFPVLERPVVDASGIEIASELRRNGADVRAARRIQTPFGPGYVFPRSGGGLCLAVPDPTGGYVQDCASKDRATARGVAANVLPGSPSERQSGTGELVVVLPADATIPVLTDESGSRRLKVKDGVATALIAADSKVAYSVAGNAVELTVPGHAPASSPAAKRCETRGGHFNRIGPGSGNCP